MNSFFSKRDVRQQQGSRLALLAMAALILNLGLGTSFTRAGTPQSASKDASTTAEPREVAMVRHTPSIAGTVEGSIRQLLPEYASIGGSAVISGDILVPGAPMVRITGHPSYGGTVDQGGAMLPNNYMVAIGGQSRLRHVVRCVDPMPMPTIASPPAPTGTEDVTLSQPDQCIRHWETVRNLSLTGQAVACPVPAGNYGAFRADAGTGFILGDPSSYSPLHYSFESLSLSSQSSLQVVGPVVVTLGSGLTLSGSWGNPANPALLKLQLSIGDLTLNSGSTLSAFVLAPRSTVFVNGNAMLVGFVAADRLWVGSGGVICGAVEGPDPQGPTDIFGYQSLWRYKVFASLDDVPSGWEEADFKATGWTSGRAAFASEGYCDMQATRQTDWPVNSVIVIRKNFRLPSTVTSLRISGTVDNEVQIFLNGRLITDWVQHDGCAQPDDLSFTAPAGSYHPGLNTIAICARDAGDQSFLDYRVSINE